MQTGLHGPAEGGRLSSLGKHETDNWPPASGPRWLVGRHKRTYGIFSCLHFPLANPVITVDNFDDYWRVASKVTPSTVASRTQSPPPSSVSMHGRPPFADPSAPSERDGAYNVRSVPVRVYLPDGPVLQELVPPMLEDS